MVADASGSVVGVLFGMDGFEVIAAADIDGELELMVQTTATVVACPQCGALAQAKDRRPVWVRDLPITGRPVVLCWHKRIWCCPYQRCGQNTWTEQHPAIPARACLTERARRWAFEQVGAHDRAVSAVACDLGVSWATINTIVVAKGQPLIDDPARLEAVKAVGVDETSFLRANARHSTMYATGIADITAGQPARLLDVTPGRSGAVLGTWLANADQNWKQHITHAALDAFRGYATALAAHLPDAVRVLDPFHVVKLALAALDEVRRRVQNQVLGHRGRRGDPLYRIRRTLRTRVERLPDHVRKRLDCGLEAGDPDWAVTVAWIIAQRLMWCYHSNNAEAAAELIEQARNCSVGEVAKLGRTLHTWRAEFLAAFTNPAITNGPTEALNLKIKNTKRTARGFRNFSNYRLRLLLNHGRIHHNQQPTPIRTRQPRLVA